MAMASKAAPPLASVCPQLPADLCKIVDLALAFARDARYPDAGTMQADVRAFRAGASPPYALARFSQRDEKTRAEPAFDPSASSSSRGPQGTLPLAQHPGVAALSSRAGLQFGQTYPSAGAPPVGLGQTFPSASAQPGAAPAYAAAAPFAPAPVAPTSTPPQVPAGHLAQTYPSAGGGAPMPLGQTHPAGSPGVAGFGAGYPAVGTRRVANAAPNASPPSAEQGLPVAAGLGQTYPSAGMANAPSPRSAPGHTRAGKSRKILWALGLLGVLVSLGMAAALWRLLGSHVAAEREGAVPSASAPSAVGVLPPRRAAPSAGAGAAAPPAASAAAIVASSPAASVSALSAREGPAVGGSRAGLSPALGSSASRAGALASAAPAAKAAGGPSRSAAPGVAAASGQAPSQAPQAPAAADAPPAPAAPAPPAPPASPAPPTSTDEARSVLPRLRKRNPN